MSEPTHDERDGLRKALEWIAAHRNDHLTDGSAATRACLDAIVAKADAALSAPVEPQRGDRVSVPDGWVLVPREPTDDMLRKGAEAGLSITVLLDDTPFACDRAVYAAMLSASPSVPASPMPADVVRLVIAGRDVAYLDIARDDEERAMFTELDGALEAFADRVAWEDEPETFVAQIREPKVGGVCPDCGEPILQAWTGGAVPEPSHDVCGCDIPSAPPATPVEGE